MRQFFVLGLLVVALCGCGGQGKVNIAQDEPTQTFIWKQDVFREYDPEYGVVCYFSRVYYGYDISCVRVE